MVVKKLPVLQAKLEKVLIEKYGVDHLQKTICHEGRDEENPGIKLSMYYTDKPQNKNGCYHVGTYNHKTKQGWHFDFSAPDGFPKSVPVV